MLCRKFLHDASVIRPINEALRWIYKRRAPLTAETVNSLDFLLRLSWNGSMRILKLESIQTVLLTRRNELN